MLPAQSAFRAGVPAYGVPASACIKLHTLAFTLQRVFIKDSKTHRSVNAISPPPGIMRKYNMNSGPHACVKKFL
jgi:hypothetical protein